MLALYGSYGVHANIEKKGVELEGVYSIMIGGALIGHRVQIHSQRHEHPLSVFWKQRDGMYLQNPWQTIFRVMVSQRTSDSNPLVVEIRIA